MSDVQILRDALETIVSGSALSIELFEDRVRARKDRLTWYAVNVLQHNLEACKRTAADALERTRGAQ